MKKSRLISESQLINKLTRIATAHQNETQKNNLVLYATSTKLCNIFCCCQICFDRYKLRDMFACNNCIVEKFKYNKLTHTHKYIIYLSVSVAQFILGVCDRMASCLWTFACSSYKHIYSYVYDDDDDDRQSTNCSDTRITSFSTYI